MLFFQHERDTVNSLYASIGKVIKTLPDKDKKNEITKIGRSLFNVLQKYVPFQS